MSDKSSPSSMKTYSKVVLVILLNFSHFYSLALLLLCAFSEKMPFSFKVAFSS